MNKIEDDNNFIEQMEKTYKELKAENVIFDNDIKDKCELIKSCQDKERHICGLLDTLRKQKDKIKETYDGKRFTIIGVAKDKFIEKYLKNNTFKERYQQIKNMLQSKRAYIRDRHQKDIFYTSDYENFNKATDVCIINRFCKKYHGAGVLFIAELESELCYTIKCKMDEHKRRLRCAEIKLFINLLDVHDFADDTYYECDDECDDECDNKYESNNDSDDDNSDDSDDN